MIGSEFKGSGGGPPDTPLKKRYPSEWLCRQGLDKALEGTAEGDRAWFRSLDPTLRSSIRLLHGLRPACNLVVLFYPTLWIAGAAVTLSTSSWPIRLAGYAASGVAIHAMATLMHEGIHGTLFHRRRLDHWCGFLLGAPAWFSFTAYKVTHMAHHRHTRTARDPDDFQNVSPSWLIRSAVFYAWLVVGMPAYMFHVPLGALRLGTQPERRAILAEYGLMASFAVVLLLISSRLGRADILVQAWLLPLVVAVVCGNVRSWAEHALTRSGHPLTQTRTVTSNRLVSFLMCNLNYHLEHHLFPGVPWYNLPRLHALLMPEYRRAGITVHRSYLGFLFAAARTGVSGTIPGELTAEQVHVVDTR